MGVGTIVVDAALVEATAVVHVPAVSTTIRSVEVGTAEVEVVAMGIAGVDAEVPVASVPVEGTIEIGGCAQGFPLPRVEHVAQVEIATLPVGTEHIVAAGDAHQIVEVYFIDGLVLGI